MGPPEGVAGCHEIPFGHLFAFDEMDVWSIRFNIPLADPRKEHERLNRKIRTCGPSSRSADRCSGDRL
jgi:hypothetical protein